MKEDEWTPSMTPAPAMPFPVRTIPQDPDKVGRAWQWLTGSTNSPRQGEGMSLKGPATSRRHCYGRRSRVHPGGRAGDRYA